MLICAVSDLHGNLPEIPECDVLAIAGDICPLEDHSRKFQHRWLRTEFTKWLRSVPARYVVGVAGNHDLVTEDALGVAPDLPWIYLCNSACEIDGVVFWGSPMSEDFPRPGVWAWMTNENALADLWERIPPRTDVLITHGPALHARDRTFFDDRAGSPSLRERIKTIRPLLHITGHIHPGYGVDAIFHREGARTVVGNASIVNGLYEPVNLPLMFNLNKKTRWVEVIST